MKGVYTPFPPFSPSLISLMVSVAVKHHVYWKAYVNDCRLKQKWDKRFSDEIKDLKKSKKKSSVSVFVFCLHCTGWYGAQKSRKCRPRFVTSSNNQQARSGGAHGQRDYHSCVIRNNTTGLAALISRASGSSLVVVLQYLCFYSYYLGIRIDKIMFALGPVEM